MNYIPRDVWDRCAIYDVETKFMAEEVEGGWDNPEAMSIASCVVYIPKINRYAFYGDMDADRERLRILLEKIPFRVGFNSIKFDNRVIFGNDYEASPWEGHLNDVDLMHVFGFSEFPEIQLPEELMNYIRSRKEGKIRNLNAYAQATLGMKKTDSGANAPFLHRKGRWVELLEYNLNDVVITAELLKFVVENGFVKTEDGREIKVRVE